MIVKFFNKQITLSEQEGNGIFSFYYQQLLVCYHHYYQKEKEIIFFEVKLNILIYLKRNFIHYQIYS